MKVALTPCEALGKTKWKNLIFTAAGHGDCDHRLFGGRLVWTHLFQRDVRHPIRQRDEVGG